RTTPRLKKVAIAERQYQWPPAAAPANTTAPVTYSFATKLSIQTSSSPAHKGHRNPRSECSNQDLKWVGRLRKTRRSFSEVINTIGLILPSQSIRRSAHRSF